MTTRGGLSVCVIACDEEAELPRCLASVSFADEMIIVVDAKSTDGTEAIAREHGTRVEVRPYAGDIEQKGYATSLATREWVLVVDPDEVVSPALGASVQRVIASGGAPNGYALDRMTWHLGRWIRHGDFYPDWTVRLFRRGAYRWGGRNPHGRIEVDGATERLGGVLEHYSYVDLADHLERVQRWSSQAAEGLDAEGRRARGVDLLLRPLWRVFRGYILKRGFLDGMPGLVVAVVNGVYVFLKYAKLWERQHQAARA